MLIRFHTWSLGVLKKPTIIYKIFETNFCALNLRYVSTGLWWKENLENFQNIMKMIVVNIYLFKANNRKTFLILWRRSGVFMVNFEHILHFFLVFLQLPLKSKSYVGSEIQFCLKSYPSCVYLFKAQKE